ncbi:MAG TPA: hypothetical protein DEB17_03425 [Chlorobaculum sp.]|uniref:Uncharacterized protein n=1 Tax=Chlorobaculum tepidum (strain ATCC 49652 / DSM 12025 / NBRC 103806 / TLS) TaxID=194439 RepID=Q8KDP4_CHLTE|nr:hypothetical protein CT1001 [Chlorobaculum tepidum TLS]HBU23035.1 hypothetical protein [Chlorobaculum sp.]
MLCVSLQIAILFLCCLVLHKELYKTKYLLDLKKYEAASNSRFILKLFREKGCFKVREVQPLQMIRDGLPESGCSCGGGKKL